MNLFSVPDFPFIQEGDSLSQLILDCLAQADNNLQSDDILVIAQKVVSKSEGRMIHLKEVEPSDEAIALAQTVDKDPRLVQVILDDSNEVIRARPGLLVVEQRNGWVCANAAVDRSNVAPEADATLGEVALLLPKDSDASARQIRHDLALAMNVDPSDAPAVLISDTHGRAWRNGNVGICIGCAGLPPLWDQRGLHDLFGYELRGSIECIADELCAAASLLMGQSNEGTPVVLVRGYRLPKQPSAPAKAIQRPVEMDAFR
ncbi:coenzyme F420-0:L-glutamate ligase [Chloroflexi bacterium TSY]|nr:coenzyme F420-0:L-glutamate ligase [Chloroflexi bacterium TSY]